MSGRLQFISLPYVGIFVCMCCIIWVKMWAKGLTRIPHISVVVDMYAMSHWCIFLCHIKSTQLYINVYWLITLQRQKLKYMTIHETAGCLINTGGLLTQFQVGLTVFVIVYYCFLFIYVYSITVINLKRPLHNTTINKCLYMNTTPCNKSMSWSWL